jgi:hypothetical protein
MRLEGLGKLKNPVTSLRFEPATFRLVAQCLNQLYCCVPQLPIKVFRSLIEKCSGRCLGKMDVDAVD